MSSPFIDKHYNSPEKILTDFNICALQRNLKACGTFAAQYVIKGNDSYLQFIKPTMNYVKNTLKDHTEFLEIEKLFTDKGIIL
jgi:aminoglycoside/choline kinase family phosphotransferase